MQSCNREYFFPTFVRGKRLRKNEAPFAIDSGGGSTYTEDNNNKETLNKSPRTSWRHLFRLVLSRNLDVHDPIRFAHMYKFALAKSKIWTLT
jgi:hypothetical protein